MVEDVCTENSKCLAVLHQAKTIVYKYHQRNSLQVYRLHISVHPYGEGEFLINYSCFLLFLANIFHVALCSNIEFQYVQ